MEYHDRVLKCGECGAEFVFTAGEQMFFADKGFKNEPKRCKNCKAERAQGGAGSGASNFTLRDENRLLAVRKRNYSAFPADARPARLLPRMFPAAACRWGHQLRIGLDGVSKYKFLRRRRPIRSRPGRIRPGFSGLISHYSKNKRPFESLNDRRAFFLEYCVESFRR